MTESKSVLKRHAVQNNTENDADKMREAFEAWAIENDHCATVGLANQPDSEITHFDENQWLAYQAATAKQNERIKDLEAQIEHQRTMLSSIDQARNIK